MTRPSCSPVLAMILAAGMAAAIASVPSPADAASDGSADGATLPDGSTPAGGMVAPPAVGRPGAEAAADEPLATRCDSPEEIAPDEERVDRIAAAFGDGTGPLTIVVLGSLSGQDDGGRGPAAFAPRLQAILQADLAARGIHRPVRIQTVGRVRALAADLAGMINREVLPLQPALAIWQAGRADARQGIPPHRFAQSLKEGLALLRDAGIPTILADIQFHPQFEALFRTDDYRNYVRWAAGKHDLPLLKRHEMIEHWSQSGRIDLDSGNDADQKAAYGFIQECLAFQAARMILGAAGLASRKPE